jgi:predicted Zn-dependent peptidase
MTKNNVFRAVSAVFFFFASLPLFAQLPPWTRFKLDNGLEVLVIENHLNPIITINLVVKNGSFTEPDDFNGLVLYG